MCEQAIAVTTASVIESQSHRTRDADRYSVRRRLFSPLCTDAYSYACRQGDGSAGRDSWLVCRAVIERRAEGQLGILVGELRGARNKAEVRMIKGVSRRPGGATLPLTETMGHRGLVFMEEYSLAGSLSMADALIAATAIEANQPLVTANDKHSKQIKKLVLIRFRP